MIKCRMNSLVAKKYIDSVTAHIMCNSVRPNNLKNCKKLIGISRVVGEGSKKKMPSVGEVWILWYCNKVGGKYIIHDISKMMLNECLPLYNAKVY